jgi:hypothetical protein
MPILAYPSLLDFLIFAVDFTNHDPALVFNLPTRGDGVALL